MHIREWFLLWISCEYTLLDRSQGVGSVYMAIHGWARDVTVTVSTRDSVWPSVV